LPLAPPPPPPLLIRGTRHCLNSKKRGNKHRRARPGARARACLAKRAPLPNCQALGSWGYGAPCPRFFGLGGYLLARPAVPTPHAGAHQGYAPQDRRGLTFLAFRGEASGGVRCVGTEVLEVLVLEGQHVLPKHPPGTPWFAKPLPDVLQPGEAPIAYLDLASLGLEHVEGEQAPGFGGCRRVRLAGFSEPKAARPRFFFRGPFGPSSPVARGLMTSVVMRSFPCEEVGELPRAPPWLGAGMRLGNQNGGLPVSKT
jgi:hypothetical protein